MGNFLINEKDNVEICLENGHKYARFDIKKGESVIKYGFPIGIASADIKAGEHVHSHNLKTALKGAQSYDYNPDYKELESAEKREIKAFVRKTAISV